MDLSFVSNLNLLVTNEHIRLRICIDKGPHDIIQVTIYCGKVNIAIFHIGH